MKSVSYTRSVVAGVLLLLVAVGAALGQPFTGCEDTFGTPSKITFEGIATSGGQAGAVNLAGNEFPGVTLSAGPGADGLFVGIPDSTIPGGNNVNFFAADFFPTSGVAVFSPDKDPSPSSPSPDGTLVVDFSLPVAGVGGYFLDAESYPSSLEAFDGPSGTGNSLGLVTVQGYPDNFQAFAHIAAPGIRSAEFVLGGGGDGVGLDDLCFPVHEVSIDIKPGSDPNCFNINGHGVVPVAILGSANLDVTMIDQAELSFAGMTVRVRAKKGPQCSFEYSDGDGYLDLVCQFEDQPEYWEPGDATATLEGRLYDGTPFQGTDFICVVPE